MSMMETLESGPVVDAPIVKEEEILPTDTSGNGDLNNPPRHVGGMDYEDDPSQPYAHAIRAAEPDSESVVYAEEKIEVPNWGERIVPFDIVSPQRGSPWMRGAQIGLPRNALRYLNR